MVSILYVPCRVQVLIPANLKEKGTLVVRVPYRHGVSPIENRTRSLSGKGSSIGQDGHGYHPPTDRIIADESEKKAEANNTSDANLSTHIRNDKDEQMPRIPPWGNSHTTLRHERVLILFQSSTPARPSRRRLGLSQAFPYIPIPNSPIHPITLKIQMKKNVLFTCKDHNPPHPLH